VPDGGRVFQPEVRRFEAEGFAFGADTRRPGDEGCCFLHVRPGA